MIGPLFMQSDSCEDLTRFSTISSDAKIVIFRKSRKRMDRKVTFAKFIHSLTRSSKSQNSQNEPLAKIRFFANVFVSISQRTRKPNAKCKPIQQQSSPVLSSLQSVESSISCPFQTPVSSLRRYNPQPPSPSQCSMHCKGKFLGRVQQIEQT